MDEHIPGPGERWELWCGCQVDLDTGMNYWSIGVPEDSDHWAAGLRAIVAEVPCPRGDGDFRQTHAGWRLGKTRFRRFVALLDAPVGKPGDMRYGSDT